LNVQNYIFSQDSVLLSGYLSTLEGSGSYLEIGVGGGGNFSIVDRRGKFDIVVGTDILPLSTLRTEVRQSSELIVADRASCFRAETFDFVAFNPPYVPSNEILDVTTDGGLGGMEVPIDFLESALSVLKPEGKIVLVLSSEDSLDVLKRFCEREKLVLSNIAETRIFFEILTLYSITRRKN
jgi:release factor glutamine methyltransferase